MTVIRLVLLALMLSACTTTRPGDFSPEQLKALPGLIMRNQP